MGGIFGQLIGDALGSYVEFEKDISYETMKKVLEMPGGGTFATAPGQVTDDSEMAIALLTALTNHTNNL
jgi:ADP-ribosyl-[dinitrogen reductase] hydrolase